MKRLYRSEKNQQIAGVCAGLAEYFNLDVTLVRVIFVIMMLAGGPGFLIYIALWWVMPTEEQIMSEEYEKRKVEDIN